MIAVIKTGGKQYAVKAGQILKVEKIEGKKGDSISFKDVLALTDSISHSIGNPLIKGAHVEAKILDQIRDNKIIVFKKRRRKNYRSTHGHRQYLTVLQIETIMHNDKKSSAPKKEKKLIKDKVNAKKNIEKKSETADKKMIKKSTPKKKSMLKATTKKTIKKKKLTK